MKIDLTDVTFLILVRLDSIQRLENTIAITNSICTYFNTNIDVLEVDSYNNNFLKSLLNRNVTYNFIEDKDPILYKTKYFNLMARNVNTRIISLWDTDIVIDKKAIEQSVNQLRNGYADVSYPYNGQCYEVLEIIRDIFLRKKDIRMLYRNVIKMDLLYPQNLVGGAIFILKDKYFCAGMENEKYYGWGNDDFDRYWRFRNHKFIIYRTENCLFHLSHPRYLNSRYRSNAHKRMSDIEIQNSKEPS